MEVTLKMRGSYEQSLQPLLWFESAYKQENHFSQTQFMRCAESLS